MITVLNEFETIPAYEFVAGDKSQTARQTAVELISALQKVSSYSCEGYWIDLAKADDDAEILDIQNQVADSFNEYAPMPESCLLILGEHEWRVIPHFETDEYPRFEEVPTDNFDGTDVNPDNDDFIYTITDHGNVTLWRWGRENPFQMNWIEEWSMV